MGTTKFRKDYQPLNYHISHTDLTVELDPHATLVTNEMKIKRTEHGDASTPLVLDGKELSFVSVAVNGRTLNADEYEATPDKLIIHQMPADCRVTVVNKIDPTENTSCEGLYRSEGVYTTQCESENFRRITYFQDRPDNLATFTTTVIGDCKANPLLLSNGDPVRQEVLPDGRHKAVYHDPNPKPSYLFALVAGDLRTVRDYAFKKNGEKVELNIHVKGDKVAKALHAMECLKEAFAWDEEKYGLPYDLNVYNIVGVPDFNAGAMENKSLNIFNDDSLLVSPETSTDTDYEWIYTVVSHEFFHNYAGNRVTIRNWFELALKEGLATQKEREFVADMLGYTVPRIGNVKTLRSVQFPEDNGPTAHPVRNDSYENISNFYTTTTYYKGSELLSMLSGLLGQDVWRAGVKEYFERLDGTAATIDEFLSVLGDVSGRDLTQFKRWYEQAGTPRLHFDEHYDPIKQTYTLKVKQTCPPTPNQVEKLPFHIPIKMGLLDGRGKDIPLKLKGERKALGTERILELTEQEQTFTFVGVKEKPTASLLRDFSAPVIVEKSVLNQDDLIFLMAHDCNQFNRWDAAQQLHQQIILQLVDDIHAGKPLRLDSRYVGATLNVLQDKNLPNDLKAEILSFPTTSELLEKMSSFDPDALSQAKTFISKTLAKAHEGEWVKIFHECQTDCRDTFSPENAGKRSLKGLALGRLMQIGSESDHAPYLQWTNDQFLRTRNMTDRLSALGSAFYLDRSKVTAKTARAADQMMDQFYDTWKHDPQVIDKWLGMQAGYDGPDTFEHMQRMLEHPAFDIKNPNNVRSLMRSFIRGNQKHFHNPEGKGYAFVADFCLALDKVNSSMAADIAHAMVLSNNLDPSRAAKRHAELHRMNQATLSSSLGEIVTKGMSSYQLPDKATTSSTNIAASSSRVTALLEEAKSFVGEDALEDFGTTTFVPQFAAAGKASASSSAPQPQRRSKRLAQKATVH